ncbi:MAG: ABC transporter substrate-binding protein [Planctomycetes bacterium]|nr:ABC transporter substrate-binding protein [Planctomycetota bacterium]
MKPTEFLEFRAMACALVVAASAFGQGATSDDPAKGEVVLPAADGWDARLVFDAGCGVWTVLGAQVQPRFACPELLAMDDRGRLTVLRSYSGKWTPQPTIEDGKWLAPAAVGDLDPALDGLEIYTGGQAGRLWQIRPRATEGFDCRVVAEWRGEEIHTVVLGDLDTSHAGRELLVFLRSGEVFRVTSDASAAHGLEIVEVARLPGRVRQAVALRDGWLATVSRTGEVGIVRLRGTQLEHMTIAQEPMGFGRLATRVEGDGECVLYATRDDGMVLRFAGTIGGDFAREVVYVGPQGLRGLVAGRFCADPRRESLAVFGYSSKVELLSRASGEPWRSETLFTDVDKGHWLTAVEVDGRNTTDELVGSGYGGRVFLLSRPPGYGLDGVLVSPEVDADPAADVALRVGVRARRGSAERLNPLRYTGGFVSKTMLFETLVRRDEAGRIVPGLAESWTFEDGGRAVRFVLRAGAVFHDGRPVDAAAVRAHFRRWVGLPEHDWLPSNRRIRDVIAESDRVVRVELDRPWALLPDLCAVNPCAIVGPGARDREGEFGAPVGSGAFAFERALDDGSRWIVRAVGEGRRIEVEALPRDTGDPVFDALRSDRIDLFLGGWDEHLPEARLAALEADPEWRVVTAPGSSVVSLVLRLDGGATSALPVRRAIADAVDRAEFVSRVESGRARICREWAAPGVEVWPRSEVGSVDASARPVGERVRVSVAEGLGGRAGDVADLVTEQLRGAGFVVVRSSPDTADVTVRTSHGLPYDPHTTLVRAFGSGSSTRGVPDALRDAVDRCASIPAEVERIPVYAEIQGLIDELVPLVPLYVPDRIAVVRAGVGGLRLGPSAYSVELSSVGRR